jgi:hypothetical protein
VTTWYDPQVAPAAHIELGTENAALDIEANEDVDGVVERATDSGATLDMASVGCELISSVLEDKVD